MIVSHNLAAMFAQRQLNVTTTYQAKSQEKLSSGYQINRAADNAAGLAISEKMRKQIRGLKRGLDNTTDGISFIQIADGAMDEAQEMVLRMEELAVQAANGTNSESDRIAINNEVQALKTEINRIGVTTKFNEEMIFEQKIEPPTIRVTGSYFAVQDVNIFNSGYDPETGKMKYGGVIIEGNRITWDTIDPDMVEIDDDGNEVFKEGEYTFVNNGKTYVIECSEGSKVPYFRRKEDFYGDITGVYIGSKKHEWSEFVGENGLTLNWYTMQSGRWTLKGADDYIDLIVSENDWNYADLGDVMDAAAAGIIEKPEMHVEESIGSIKNEQAMETLGSKTMNVTKKSVIKQLIDAQDEGKILTYRVRAGKEDKNSPSDSDYEKNGIWLEKNVNGNWEYIDGSLQTWEQVGLKDASSPMWNSTDEIRKSVQNKVVYSYMDETGTIVGFDFKIDSDATSMDSIIAGLDKAYAIAQEARTSYETELSDGIADSNVLNVTFTPIEGELLSVEEEYDLGRDYTKKTQSGVVIGYGEASENGKTVSVTFDEGGSHEKIYLADSSSQLKTATDTISAIAAFVESAKKNALINGQNPDEVKIESTVKSIDTILGEGNYTDTGLQSEVIKVNFSEGWVVSNGLSGAVGGKPLYDGKSYGAARLDFDNVTNIMELDQSGFDATCGFCDNHYSVQFVRASSGDGFDSLTDSNGNELRYELFKLDGGHSGTYRGHFMMKVDLNSFLTAGYTDGESFSKALVEVLSGKMGYNDSNDGEELDGMDFHYTQFAAHGTEFYVANNMNMISTVNKKAKFGLAPYEGFVPKTVADFSFELKNSDEHVIELGYTYDFTYIKDDVNVTMQSVNFADRDEIEDALDSGRELYEKVNDASGGFHYERYSIPSDQNSSVPSSLYEVQVTYGDSGQYSSYKELAKAEAIEAVDSMLKVKNISYNATDYTKLTWKTEENTNIAKSALFDTIIYSPGYQHQKTVRIQHSSEAADFTAIPKFTLNTFVLGLYRADCSTADNALNTIHMIEKAMKGLNYRRSMYGAIQNRLEHTYKNRGNVMENTQAAESRLRDTDMAEEIQKYSNHNILVQAGQAMLAQANQSKQGVLTLLGA